MHQRNRNWRGIGWAAYNQKKLSMFFRRETVRTLSLTEQLDKLRSAGYATESVPDGGTLVSKGGLGLIVRPDSGGQPEITESGILIGKELGLLTDVGYQKVFRTESGKAVAAQADYLRALHSFNEDIRESLGITSLYNQSLGSTNERHMYDRVENRDHGVPKRAWEVKASR